MLQYCHATLNAAKALPQRDYAFTILADCRETKVIPHLNVAAGAPVNVRQIECGDFQVWCSNQAGLEVPAIVIERKTWKDLASSIIDGRADSQHKRMLEFRDKTGSLVYYIIEGPVFQPSDRRFARTNLTFSSLVKRLDHWAETGTVVVKHSKDHEDTARRIVELVRNLSDSRTSALFGDLERASVAAPANCRVSETPVVSPHWRSLKGVSESTAVLLSKKFKLNEFLQMNSPADVDALVGYLRSCGVRSGRKSAEKLLRPDPALFLKSIKGVSAQRARAIADAYPNCLGDISRGDGEILEKICELPGAKKNRTLATKIRDAIFEL